MLLTAATLSAALVSCRDDVEIPGNKPGDANGESTVVLSLSMSRSASRAADEGGHEALSALERECEIKEVSIFTYNNVNGLNGTADTPILFSCYFKDTDTVFTKTDSGVELRFPIESGKIVLGDRMIVLANMGDLTKKEDFATLGGIQEYVHNATYTHAFLPGSCRNFAMANAYDTDGLVQALPTIDAKSDLYVRLAVERLAARIDFNWHSSEGSYYATDSEDGALWFEVKGRFGEEENADLGRVYITHVLPMNVNRTGTYAFKRVSNGTGSDFCTNIAYAKQIPFANGVAQAYVIEPHTAAKPGEAKKNEDWYGLTQAERVRDSTAFFTDENHISKLMANPGACPETGVTIISYADENTQHVSANNVACLTGLVIRGQFIPRVLYKNYTCTDSILEEDIARGTDLYRYTPQVSATEEGDVRYFDNEDDANQYAKDHPSEMGLVKKFPEGVCFYHMWIRHADGVIGAENPMDYAIVRNHVYRVIFNFKGIGREGIKIESPDNVDAKILVRPWNVINHTEIVM